MCYADSFQQIQKTRIKRVLLYLAEREGFEPSLGLTLNTLSRRAPSATQPPLQIFVLFAVNANNEILPKHLPRARV